MLTLSSSAQEATNTIPVTGILSVVGNSTRMNIRNGVHEQTNFGQRFRVTQQLRTSVLPSNASNRRIHWTTSNPNVVNFITDDHMSTLLSPPITDFNNTPVHVAALRTGTAYITATAEDGGFIAVYRIEVYNNYWRHLIWSLIVLATIVVVFWAFGGVDAVLRFLNLG